MPKLNLKPNHKAIRDFYATLQQYEQHDIRHEGAVSSPFDTLLQVCAKQINATLVPQYLMRTPKGNRIVIDGAILDAYGLPLAYWEAKDIDDDLSRAVQQKQDAGYPLDNTLTKWDIFHYTYALLHHPTYREKYEMNLKRDLPHIPFTEDFWGFTNAGAALADLHVNYESVPKYDGLKYIETPGMRVDWRVEKMKLSKDKTQLKYNDFLTLDSIPAEVYDYRLGTRSALEWVVDQYRVKTDKRSGIVNDPNCKTEPRYIVDLIARVITVSLETVKIVKSLPAL